MVRKNENDKVDDSIADVPKCFVCNSDGPFARAFQCCFKQEHRRHSFFICSSKRCEGKFEKDVLIAAEKGCVLQVANKIKDAAKKGTLHCPQCFFMLRELPPPKVGIMEDAIPPPPPLAKASSEDVASTLEEEEEAKQQSGQSEDSKEDKTGPEWLDIENCIVHIKESDKSPTNGGKKHGKKNKRQSNTLNREVAQALFFEDSRHKPPPARKWSLPDASSENADLSPTSSQAQATEPSGYNTKDGETSQRLPPTMQAEKEAAAQNVALSPTTSKVIKTEPTTSKVIKTEPARNEKTRSEIFKKLPPDWKEEWDGASKTYYYWHTRTREVTWDFPIERNEDLKKASVSIGEAVKKDAIEVHAGLNSPTVSTMCSGNSPSVSTMCSVASSGAVEYLVIRSWIPSESDKQGGACIRVTHGERVVLEGETLDGWGIGSVVPERGESARSGRFPRKVLSDNPVSNPKVLAKGVHVKVIDEFLAPADGYLSTSMGEILRVKYQAEPFVWVWAEAVSDASRNGWVPEAVLVMA